MRRTEFGLAATRPIDRLNQHFGVFFGQPVFHFFVPSDRFAGLSCKADQVYHTTGDLAFHLIDQARLARRLAA